MKQEDPIERHLETLLQGWAARHALPISRIEGIRHAIVQTSAPLTTELPVAWWQQVFGKLEAALKRSTEMKQFTSCFAGNSLHGPMRTVGDRAIGFDLQGRAPIR